MEQCTKRWVKMRLKTFYLGECGYHSNVLVIIIAVASIVTIAVAWMAYYRLVKDCYDRDRDARNRTLIKK
jgi:hypothetical protein